MALCAGLCVASAAHADVLNAVNYTRLSACGAPGARLGLRPDSKLQTAARRAAAGGSLREALAAVGYVATQSSVLHLSGPTADADVSRALAANYCRTLTDPAIRDIGIERRGRDTWIVLGVPAALSALSDASAISRRIVELVNQARAAGRRCGSKYFGPAGPLLLSQALNTAALEHSRDMALHDEFDHRGHDGSTPATRVERAGYRAHRIVGENIAAGALSATEVTQGWLASPAHCENIMDPRFLDIGVGYAENPHTASAVFWTQDFAAHR